jgi:hypothetical protein
MEKQMRHFIRYAADYGTWLLHRDLGDGRVNIISQLTDEDLVRITRDFRMFQYKKERYMEEVEDLIRNEEAHLAYVEKAFPAGTELSNQMTKSIRERLDYYKQLKGVSDGSIQIEGYEEPIGAGPGNVDAEPSE